jgi:hypothetical protein
MSLRPIDAYVNLIDQLSALIESCIRPGVTKSLWVFNANTTQEVLRVIGINNIFANPHASPPAVLVFPDEIFEGVPKSRAVTETECVFPFGVGHQNDLPGSK